MFCTIQLSKSDPTPLYIQLAQELAILIKKGVFAPNTKLPTIRSLSRKLNINRDTVVSAYKLLENQSLVVGHVGSGTYVSPFYTPSTPSTLEVTLPCSTLSFPKSFFPPSILEELMHEIIKADGWSVFSDPLQRNKNAMRHTLVAYFQSLGIETTSPQVHLINDLHTFWVNLLKLHPNPCVCVEEYSNPSLIVFLKSLGIKVLEIPLTPSGMDIDYLMHTLEHHPVSFICTSSYIQNPTSICYTLDTKEKILHLADTYKCYILDDLTYIDFAYSCTEVKPFFVLDEHERVITLHQFSKVYLPYLNYSFVAVPPHLTKRLVGLSTYTLNEHVLYHYLNSAHFSALRVQLLEQSRLLYNLVSKTLLLRANSLQTYSFEGGISFFIRPLTLDPQAFINHFLSHGIIISPSEIFSTKCHTDYFRVSLSHLNESACLQLIDCLEQLPN